VTSTSYAPGVTAAPVARARRGIPAEVRDEMAAAARMYDVLQAQGHAMRFEQQPQAQRVTAELRTVGGDVVRRVPLVEAIDIVGGPDFAA
jgi:hypothetical protein